MIRTGCNNDLSDLTKVANVLRDQFGTYHEREVRGKGRGHGHPRQDFGRRSWYGSTRTSYLSDGYQATASSTTATHEDYDDTAGTQTEYEGYEDHSQVYDDDYDDEVVYPEDDERAREIEEEVIAWYAGQVDPQTCSQEDLDMMVEAVEIEVAAYYTKSHAEARGLSTPAGRSYESSSMTPQERQARVLSAKQRSRCRACGQIGHWQRDPICPKARGKGSGGFKSKGKGKGGFRKGGKDGGKNGKKGKSHSDSPPKSRVVYFSVGAEALPHSTSFMALGDRAGGPGQPHLDADQQRQLEERAVEMLHQIDPEEFTRQIDHRATGARRLRGAGGGVHVATPGGDRLHVPERAGVHAAHEQGPGCRQGLDTTTFGGMERGEQRGRATGIL